MPYFRAPASLIPTSLTMLEKITDNLHIPYGVRDIQLLAGGITFFLLLWLHQHTVITKMFALQREVGTTAGLVITVAAAFVAGRVLVVVGDAIANIGLFMIQNLHNPVRIATRIYKQFATFQTLRQAYSLQAQECSKMK